MEYRCEKCMRLSEGTLCPYCGNPDAREPGEDDLCFLAEWCGSGAAVIADVLKQYGIPFRVEQSPFSLRRGYFRFFVPFSRLEDADFEIRNLWNGNPSAAERQDGDSELFEGDEIDRMEAAALDGLDKEELKAYRTRVVRTLREIRVQEQKWKQRANLLRDMKEEAENLIEDLS